MTDDLTLCRLCLNPVLGSHSIDGDPFCHPVTEPERPRLRYSCLETIGWTLSLLEGREIGDPDRLDPVLSARARLWLAARHLPI